MKKAIFLTEGSNEIGFGHVSRCSALFCALKKEKFSVQFIANVDNNIKTVLKDIDCKRIDWVNNIDKIKHVLDDADICIIDSYLAPKYIYKEVSDIVRKVVCFDDFNRINYPAKCIIVNGNINAEQINYKHNMNSKYLLGLKFLCLRQAFTNSSEKNIRKKVKSLLITAGGSNLNNILPDIVKKLRNKYGDIRKTIVVSKGFGRLKSLQKILDDTMQVKTNLCAKEFKKLMISSDLAISAGGQTVYELASLGVPAIIFAIAPNQLGHIKVFDDKRIIKYAGSWKNKRKTIENIMESLQFLLDYNERRKMSLIGQKSIDGKGAYRIAKYLKNLK